MNMMYKLSFVIICGMALGCGTSLKKHSVDHLHDKKIPAKENKTISKIPIIDAESVNSGMVFHTLISDLDLQLPGKLQNILSVKNTESVQSAGTDTFMIEGKSINNITGKEETKQFASDIQTTVSKCDINALAANLKTNFSDSGANIGRKLTFTGVNNSKFSGYSYLAVDYKYPDKNLIIGALNITTGDCYSTSLAVYDVGDMKEDLFQKNVKYVEDLIVNSYKNLCTP